MNTPDKSMITVEALVQAPIGKVWEYWTDPAHIAQWCSASEDWHAPHAENDLRIDGKFKTTMAAKDGSFSFDFEGVYTDVQKNALIAYVLGDGREVKITFSDQGTATAITEIFDAESTHPIEMQQQGWQAILENFKRYTEGS